MYIKMFKIKYMLIMLLLFCNIQVNFAQKNVEIKLIKDFFKRQMEPCIVTSFLCWAKNDLIKLSMIFSEENMYSSIRKTNIENLNIPYKEQHFMIMDLNCQNSPKILQKANADHLFRIKFRWIIFVNAENMEQIPEIFKNMDILFDSRVVLAQKTSETEFSLKYIYKLGPKTNVISTNIGDWNTQKGFLVYKNPPVTWQRKQFNRHVVKVALVYTANDSINHMEDYRFKNVDTPCKLNYFVTKYVLEFMNATREIIWDRKWGEYIGNNTFTGTLGRFHRKEVDLGGPLFCVKERLFLMDCVAMTTPAKGFFLFKQPPLSYVANIFTLPFETNLWLTDIAFLIICALFIYLVSIWEWKILEERNKSPDLDMIDKKFWESIMFTIGAVCQQGYPTEPKSGSGKIIILTLCFTLIFMFTAFSANTVVLFQSSASNIKTLEDLYNSKMPLGVVDELYLRFWFPRTFEPTRRKIYLERIAPKGKKPNFLPLEEGIEKMRKGYFAFHTDAIAGYKVVSDTFEEHEKCGLQTISYLYVSDPWAISTKNSSYREVFYIGYRMLDERGLVKREIKRLYAQKPECISQGSNFRSAGILDLYSVYMLFVFGISGSFGLLIFEILTKKFFEPYMLKKYYKKKIVSETLKRSKKNLNLRRYN